MSQRFRQSVRQVYYWATFDAKTDLLKMSITALKKGLNIDDGLFHKNELFDVNGLRLEFASLNEGEMIQAMEILKTVLIGGQ